MNIFFSCGKAGGKNCLYCKQWKQIALTTPNKTNIYSYNQKGYRRIQLQWGFMSYQNSPQVVVSCFLTLWPALPASFSGAALWLSGSRLSSCVVDWLPSQHVFLLKSRSLLQGWCTHSSNSCSLFGPNCGVYSSPNNLQWIRGYIMLIIFTSPDTSRTEYLIVYLRERERVNKYSKKSQVLVSNKEKECMLGM